MEGGDGGGTGGWVGGWGRMTEGRDEEGALAKEVRGRVERNGGWIHLPSYCCFVVAVVIAGKLFFSADEDIKDPSAEDQGLSTRKHSLL